MTGRTEKMDEPKLRFEMSPGRKWNLRVGVLCVIALAAVGAGSIARSADHEPWQRVVNPLLLMVTGPCLLRLVWKSTAGVPLDPPGSYEPERHPPEQRDRARMTWGECVFSWFMVGVLVLLLIAWLSAVLRK